jgi:hypothetical protein
VRYARNPCVLWRSTSRGPVVLVPGHDDPERLGGLAALVWEVLDEPLTLEALHEEAMGLLDQAPRLSPCVDGLVAAGVVVRLDA